MTPRTRQVVMGSLFWVVFALPAILAIALQPLGILLYALGNDNIRAWVYRTGRALDQLNNAAWFGGHAQETISSHTGRYLRYGGKLPWRFRFVHWLTNWFETDHVVKAIEPMFRDTSL